MDSRPVARTDLARSEATVAPRDIATDQVVEHALRHLAWLAEDDPVVRGELPPAWRAALAGLRARSRSGTSASVGGAP